MKNYITIAALLAAGTAFANAAVYTWTGDAGSGLWSESGNWNLNNNYYPQSGSDTAIIGENEGTIIWDKDGTGNLFGHTDTITVKSGSTIDCRFGGPSGIYFNTLNLYGGSFTAAQGENAFGFEVDFTVNFGEITDGDAYGCFDLSTFSGAVWTNGKKITATATVDLREACDAGTISLMKFASSMGSGGAASLDTTGVSVQGLIKNETAKVLSDLSVGEYAIIASAGSNGGLSIIYNAASVPEPSAFGLLAGLGALALVASRRRRK